jgi:hypothetical protein
MKPETNLHRRGSAAGFLIFTRPATLIQPEND